MRARRQNILITGASSGLGAQMARIFAARGHGLALAARREDRLRLLAEEFRGIDPSATVATYQLDVNHHERVAQVFDQAAADLGGLDRVIVNAGVGNGARIGAGGLADNVETARTNFVAAVAQADAAMAQFYERGSGHLVLISSVSAMRGMPGSMATYGASKAAVAQLGEGIRMDLAKRGGHDIVVTTVFPGYIATELNAGVRSRLKVPLEQGCQALVKQVDREVAQAWVPPWPWRGISFVLRHAPFAVARRMV